MKTASKNYFTPTIVGEIMVNIKKAMLFDLDYYILPSSNKFGDQRILLACQ
jgi:hypothetical protein